MLLEPNPSDVFTTPRPCLDMDNGAGRKEKKCNEARGAGGREVRAFVGRRIEKNISRNNVKKELKNLLVNIPKYPLYLTKLSSRRITVSHKTEIKTHFQFEKGKLNPENSEFNYF